MHMVKVISLSEEAYKVLSRMKSEGMSFSEVILENIGNGVNKKENLDDLIKWVKAFKQTGSKQKISKNVDEIVYGIKK